MEERGPEAGKEGTIITVLERTEASLPKGGALPPTKRSEKICQLPRRQDQHDLATDGAGGEEGRVEDGSSFLAQQSEAVGLF